MRRIGTLAAMLAGAGLTVACASGGAVPRPFPGASYPGGGDTRAEPTPSPVVDAVVEPVTGADALVATALTLRGAPYRNGGSSPGGFDCSGLVQYVFNLHGLPLPRETREQFTVGRSVDVEDIAAGDLIFFDTTGLGVSHVGLAINPEEFVHAPNSRGVVRVERLASSYWSRRVLGVRRVEAAKP